MQPVTRRISARASYTVLDLDPWKPRRSRVHDTISAPYISASWPPTARRHGVSLNNDGGATIALAISSNQYAARGRAPARPPHSTRWHPARRRQRAPHHTTASCQATPAVVQDPPREAGGGLLLLRGLLRRCQRRASGVRSRDERSAPCTPVTGELRGGCAPWYRHPCRHHQPRSPASCENHLTDDWHTPRPDPADPTSQAWAGGLEAGDAVVAATKQGWWYATMGRGVEDSETVWVQDDAVWVVRDLQSTSASRSLRTLRRRRQDDTTIEVDTGRRIVWMECAPASP
jgi:hypothetical protein